MIRDIEHSWGTCAVVRVRGIDVLVTSVRAQLLDLAQFQCVGIDPHTKKVVALKSMQHFRAAFEPLVVSGAVIVCDSGALCTVDYARMPFTRVPRPLFPLDPDLNLTDWLAANNNGIYIPPLRTTTTTSATAVAADSAVSGAAAASSSLSSRPLTQAVEKIAATAGQLEAEQDAADQALFADLKLLHNLLRARDPDEQTTREQEVVTACQQVFARDRAP
jgi:hypothetical protein